MVSNSTLPTRPRRFAVVGAGGVTGVASLRVLLSELRDYILAGDTEVIGFEQREDIGGVWLAEPRPDPSNQEWPETPAYDSLRTNIAHPLMYYPSHPAPPSTPLLTDAQTVNDYLRSYVDKFDLWKYIRFNTRVTAATWDSSTNQWTVITQPYVNHRNTGPETTWHFDHLLVANGHNRRPFIPDITGLEDWASCSSRSYIHSIRYRTPDAYRNHEVLVIGGGLSGMDCSAEISTVASKTVHSIRSLKEDQESERVTRRGEISHLTPDGFVYFKNGKSEYVDRVVFATGYEYDCSFLTQLPVEAPQDESDHLYNSRFHIYPLALHTFPLRAAFPPNSLAFIGLATGVPVLTAAEVHATLAVRLMAGTVSIDFDYELGRTVRRNEWLHGKYLSALGVAKGWHRFGRDQGHPYDFLDLLWELANDSQRIPKWGRDIAPVRKVIVGEWRKLESLGLAKEWAHGVGNGGVQEWVDLMWRVVRRATEQ